MERLDRVTSALAATLSQLEEAREAAAREAEGRLLLLALVAAWLREPEGAAAVTTAAEGGCLAAQEVLRMVAAQPPLPVGHQPIAGSGSAFAAFTGVPHHPSGARQANHQPPVTLSTPFAAAAGRYGPLLAPPPPLMTLSNPPDAAAPLNPCRPQPMTAPLLLDPPTPHAAAASALLSHHLRLAGLRHGGGVEGPAAGISQPPTAAAAAAAGGDESNTAVLCGGGGGGLGGAGRAPSLAVGAGCGVTPLLAAAARRDLAATCGGLLPRAVQQLLRDAVADACQPSAAAVSAAAATAAASGAADQDAAAAGNGSCARSRTTASGGGEGGNNASGSSSSTLSGGCGGVLVTTGVPRLLEPFDAGGRAGVSGKAAALLASAGALLLGPGGGGGGDGGRECFEPPGGAAE